MRHLTLALAGTLIAAAGLAATAAPAAGSGTVAQAGRKAPHARVPSGGLVADHRRQRRAAPQISPHIGLPGISGFPSFSEDSRRQRRSVPQISPHIGLPGFSGLPSFSEDFRKHRRRGDRFDHDFGFWGYEGDGDGYVDTIPTPDQFGYFATGGFVTMERDRPVYHYDRSYPYEFGGPRTTGPAAASGLHCQVRNVWDEEQRKEIPVRVCGAY